MATSEYQPLLPRPRFDVHPKQREAVESDARYRILQWGRRGGKNITAIIDCIERGRAPWLSEWGADDPEQALIWWVGRSYDQAEKYGFNKLEAAIPDSWIADVVRSEPYEIHLTNGVRYEFRTYDHPETLQGAGVDHVFVDEADYMPDSLWYDDLDPMLLDTRGSAMFISKPVRPHSYFQKLYEKGQSADYPQYFASHATSADNPFIEEDPADKRGTVPDHKFRQQYLAELPDDGGQVFSGLDDYLFTGDYDIEGEVVDGIGEVWVDPDNESDEGEWSPTAPYVTGADFAQRRDYRVTGVLDATGRLVYYKRSQNESWRNIQSHLESVASKYPGVLVPDATRDNKIVADLWHAGIDVEPVKFSPQRKVDLIDNLITAVETGELTIADDPRLDQIRLELRIFEKEVTSSGYTKYHAPESGHDDCVDMLALAYSALDSAGIASETARLGEDDEDDFQASPFGQAVQDYQRRQRGPFG